jgi:hypothetical protein
MGEVRAFLGDIDRPSILRGNDYPEKKEGLAMGNVTDEEKKVSLGWTMLFILVSWVIIGFLAPIVSAYVKSNWCETALLVLLALLVYLVPWHLFRRLEH